MDNLNKRHFTDLNIGDSASLTRQVTLHDIKLITATLEKMSEDKVGQCVLAGFPLEEIIKQPFWEASLLSVALETQLPDYKMHCTEVLINNIEQCVLGEPAHISLMVKNKDSSKHFITYKVLCVNADNKSIIDAEVTVQFLSQKPQPEGKECRRHDRPHLKILLSLAAILKPLRTAVVHPTSTEALEGALDAAKFGLIDPVFIGPKEKILNVAKKLNRDLSDYEIINTEHSHAAAIKSVALAFENQVQAIMKGNLHTDELMHAVLNKTSGLRTERRMSHVFAFDVPTYPRPLLITDAAINIYPSLEDKKDILQNALDLAHALHIKNPKVAILSAVETVSPYLKSTIEAAALCKMVDRRQITGGIVDGPLAFDNAISEAAALTKGIDSPVAGQADILLVPDVESGNMLAKQLEYLGDAEGAGIVLGARVPIILTSRADDTTSRMASCALAVLLAHKQRLK